VVVAAGHGEVDAVDERDVHLGAHDRRQQFAVAGDHIALQFEIDA